MQALLWRQRSPLTYQLRALCWRQLLKVLERSVQLSALLWRHVVELVPVGARPRALFRGHLLPVGNVLADGCTALGGQCGPAFRALEHAFLPAG